MLHKVSSESPDEHEQNPRGESAIGLLSMCCRVMLCASGLPKFYWGFCILYAAECENRTLPFKSNSNHTCYEAFHGVCPDNSFLKPFGCAAYVHVRKTKRKDQKLDNTAILGVFLGLGFHMGYKAYVIGALDGKRLYITRNNVTFNESWMPFKEHAKPGDAFWGTKNLPDRPDLIITTIAGTRLEDMTPDDFGTEDVVYDPEIVTDLEVEEEVIMQSPEDQNRVMTQAQHRHAESSESMAQVRTDVEEEMRNADTWKKRRQEYNKLPDGSQLAHGALDEGQPDQRTPDKNAREDQPSQDATMEERPDERPREKRWVRAPERRYQELPGVEAESVPDSSARLRRSVR